MIESGVDCAPHILFQLSVCLSNHYRFPSNVSDALSRDSLPPDDVSSGGLLLSRRLNVELVAFLLSKKQVKISKPPNDKCGRSEYASTLSRHSYYNTKA